MIQCQKYIYNIIRWNNIFERKKKKKINKGRRKFPFKFMHIYFCIREIFHFFLEDRKISLYKYT